MIEKPSIVVIGAGAMGSVFGGLLAEGGLPVTLVDVWQEHVDRINRHGLELNGHGGERFVRVHATTDIRTVSGADIVFFQCKATANGVAARSAARLFKKTDTTAISFQNGLGNEEEIGSIIGSDAIVAGLTAQAAILSGPGKVTHFDNLPSYIGEIGGGLSKRVDRIAAALTAAGLPTHPSASIMREKWSKLLVNIAFAGTSGMTGLTLGEVIEDVDLSAIAASAMDEATDVARATGIELNPQGRRAVFDSIMRGPGRNNKASVLADLSAGRKTEVDYIYGTAIQLADRYGIPVPTLKFLSAMIKGREIGNSRVARK
jgi:2-dehydropantoate 2-reductase